jgi:hypothetical protein
VIWSMTCPNLVVCKPGLSAIILILVRAVQATDEEEKKVTKACRKVVVDTIILKQNRCGA